MLYVLDIPISIHHSQLGHGSVFGEVSGCGYLFKTLIPGPKFSRVGVSEAAVCTAY